LPWRRSVTPTAGGQTQPADGSFNRYAEMRRSAAGLASKHEQQNALVDLLGNPIADSNAFYIPTATHANPGGSAQAWNFIAARGS
jgi:hypothetical protein